MAENSELFNPLSPENEPIVMESFCVNCEKNGKTTILLTKIPFFKEIIIASFYCDSCGYRNSEIQSGGKLNENGHKITLKVTVSEDLSRDVVKSEFATIKIPEIELEVPSSRKGHLNTIEGFLHNFYDELNSLQEERKKFDTSTYEKIELFLSKLKSFALGEVLPFTFILDDPSGNSYIKNPHAPKEDPNLILEIYQRTNEHLVKMGFDVENSISNADNQSKENGNNHDSNAQKIKEEQIHEESKTQEPALVQVGAHRLDFTKPLVEDLKQESFTFTTDCHVCLGKTSETKMCVITIPYFKELIVMSSVCSKCGAKTSETKTGGEISKTGKIITLKVETEEDLRRDCFKSETCVMSIPEVELELAHGTSGGRYTTVEGLIDEVEKNLKNNNPFFGDSGDSLFKKRMEDFFAKLKNLKKLKTLFTIILKDPLDNSFIQNPYYPEKDPRCTIEVYERSFEENEYLGLNDIKTENY